MFEDQENEKNKNVFEEIIEPIESCVNNIQESLKGDYLLYKLSFSTFTTNILYAIICQIRSIGKLVTETQTSPIAKQLELPTASKSMYNEAFYRYSPEMYRKIFAHLINSCNFLCIPEISHLGQILLVDGSFFPAISTMTWAKYKTGCNSIKMHLSFDLNRMIPVQFLATDGKYSEKKFLRDIIEKGITYICDRGYISFNLFYEICIKDAFFIIRGKSNLLYDLKQELKVVIPEKFNPFFENITDSLVIFNNDSHEKIYRIVKFVALGESYTLITNRLDITTYEIIMLYAYRWQIELCFRFIKRTFKCIHLMNHSEKGIQIQFYLYMIAYLLMLSFKQRCEFYNDLDEDNENLNFDTYVSKNNNKDTEGQNISNQAFDANTNLKKVSKSRRCYACGIVSLLGKKLKKFWKICSHWLIALKNLLATPFDNEVIRILSTIAS